MVPVGKAEPAAIERRFVCSVNCCSTGDARWRASRASTASLMAPGACRRICPARVTASSGSRPSARPVRCHAVGFAERVVASGAHGSAQLAVRSASGIRQVGDQVVQRGERDAGALRIPPGHRTGTQGPTSEAMSPNRTPLNPGNSGRRDGSPDAVLQQQRVECRGLGSPDERFSRRRCLEPASAPGDSRTVSVDVAGQEVPTATGSTAPRAGTARRCGASRPRRRCGSRSCLRFPPRPSRSTTTGCRRSSGTASGRASPARDLRISTDGLYIAEALIGGRDPHARAWARRRARRRERPRRDPHARAWAINTLPVAILIECRKLRGCDTGTPRRWLNCAIEHRSDG